MPRYTNKLLSKVSFLSLSNCPSSSSSDVTLGRTPLNKWKRMSSTTGIESVCWRLRTEDASSRISECNSSLSINCKHMQKIYCWHYYDKLSSGCIKAWQKFSMLGEANREEYGKEGTTNRPILLAVSILF